MGKKQKNVPGQQPVEPSQPGQIMQDDGSSQDAETFSNIEPDNFSNINPTQQ